MHSCLSATDQFDTKVFVLATLLSCLFAMLPSRAGIAGDVQPAWSRNDSGVVVFGIPASGTVYLTLSCQMPDKIAVGIVMRPANLRDNEQTTAVFDAAVRTVRRIATAPVPDGLGGDNVVVVAGPSDELFDLMIGPKRLTVRVGQEKLTVPLKGAAELIGGLRRDCSTRHPSRALP